MNRHIENSYLKMWLFLPLLCSLAFLTGCAKSDHFLWKSEKNGRTIFLLGVSHDVPIEASKIPTHVQTAANSANIFVIEIFKYESENFVAFPQTTDLIQSSLLLLEDLQRENLVTSAEKYALARTPIYLLADEVEKIINRNRNKNGMMDSKQQVTLVKGLDFQLFQQALRKKIKLERLDFPHVGHVEWQKNCNDSKHHTSLIKFIRNGSTDKNLYALEREYLIEGAFKLEHGDEKFFIENFEKLRQVNEIQNLITQCTVLPRNKNWVSKIEAIVKSAPKDEVIFIAVGVAHLLFEPTILTLLEKEGFAFKRVRSNAKQID